MYHIYIYLSIFIHYKEWRFWKFSYLNIFPYIPHNESIDMLIKEGWSFWGGKEINIFKIGWAIFPLYFYRFFLRTSPHPHSRSIPTPHKNSCNKILVIGNYYVCCFSPTYVIGNTIGKRLAKTLSKKGLARLSSM